MKIKGQLPKDHKLWIHLAHINQNKFYLYHRDPDHDIEMRLRSSSDEVTLTDSSDVEGSKGIGRGRFDQLNIHSGPSSKKRMIRFCLEQWAPSLGGAAIVTLVTNDSQLRYRLENQ